MPLTQTANLLKFRLIGVRPLILHNGLLADPTYWATKELRKITEKTKKTEADFERMAELEFKGGLYLNESKHVILEPEGIKAMIVSGARKSKEGKYAQAGVRILNRALLDYKEGPKTADELWENERFRFRAMVKIGTSKVARMRPIFRDWSCDIEVNFNPDVCNPDQIFKWLRVCGEQCGCFDWRPDYGLFSVEKI